MQTRFPRRCLPSPRLSLLAVALVMVVLAGVPCPAWDCDEAHPTINELAGKHFIMKSQSTLFGTKYQQAPVDFRMVFAGRSYASGKGPLSWSKRETSTEANTLQWLARGGHDADMPEMVMGFRHFYDPVYEPRYLTWLSRKVRVPKAADGMSIDDYFDSFDYRADDWNPRRELVNGNTDRVPLPHLIDPKIDGITWGLSHPQNEHSWEHGLQAYKAAFEDDKAAFGSLTRSQMYGKAFRALGETMHLLGDMTQPSHVRADSHSLYEPLEKTIRATVIHQVVGENWRRADYLPTSDFPNARGLSPEQLMKQTAAWTNAHFFSNDTIHDFALGVFPRNRKRPYPSPSLSKLREQDGTFYATFAGVGEVPLAKNTGGLFAIALAKKAKPDPEKLRLHVLPEMAVDQARVLMPIAIHVCAELIDRFFPTLTMSLALEPEDGRTWRATGTLTHDVASDPAWTKLGAISYTGAGQLVVNGQRQVECNFVRGVMTPVSLDLVKGDKVMLVVTAGARIVRSGSVSAR